jgi:hypothetical protein
MERVRICSCAEIYTRTREQQLESFRGSIKRSRGNERNSSKLDGLLMSPGRPEEYRQKIHTLILKLLHDSDEL